MSKFERSTRPSTAFVLRYGLAVLSVAAALSITQLLRAYFETTANSLFFCAIVISSWFGGLGPGLLRSEEHTSELQSHHDIVCRLLLEKKYLTQLNAERRTEEKDKDATDGKIKGFRVFTNNELGCDEYYAQICDAGDHVMINQSNSSYT